MHSFLIYTLVVIIKREGFNVKFGEKIKEIRERRGFSQKEVAEKIGVACSTYSLYESGKREPDVEKIKKIAKALEVSGDDLLDIDISYEPLSLILDSNEISLIEKYRSLDSISKECVNNSLNFEYEQTKKRSSEKADEFNLTEEEQEFLMKFREIKDVDVRVLSRMLNSMYERKDRERSSANHTDGKEA